MTPALPPTLRRSLVRLVLGAATLTATLAFAQQADDLLAPRLVTLERSMARTTELLDQAKVFQDQLAVAQSLFVKDGCATGGCPPERSAQLIADAQYAGHASRDLLQAARAETDRTVAISVAETVVPLLSDERREAVETLRHRSETATRAWLVRTAWYNKRMSPWAGNLKARLATTCAREPGAGAEEAMP